jgi:hypothetical protein
MGFSPGLTAKSPRLVPGCDTSVRRCWWLKLAGRTHCYDYCLAEDGCHTTTAVVAFRIMISATKTCRSDTIKSSSLQRSRGCCFSSSSYEWPKQGIVVRPVWLPRCYIDTSGSCALDHCGAYKAFGPRTFLPEFSFGVYVALSHCMLPLNCRGWIGF